MKGIFRVVNLLFQPQNFLQIGYLRILGDAFVVGVFHVQQLAAERIHAVQIAPDLRQTRDRHRLGRVTFRQDQRAFLGKASARLVGITQLRNPLHAIRLAPVAFAQLFPVFVLDHLHHPLFDVGVLHQTLDEAELYDALRPKLGRICRQPLFRLTVEARVHDGRLDENFELVLDITRLYLGFVLLREFRRNVFADLRTHAVDVRAPRGRRYPVHKRHVFEHLVVVCCCRYFPVLVAVNVHYILIGGYVGRIRGEIVALDQRPVEVDADRVPGPGCRVPRATSEQIDLVRRYTSRAEPNKVRRKRHLSVRLVLVRSQHHRMHVPHVVAPPQFQLFLLRHRRHPEIC